MKEFSEFGALSRRLWLAALLFVLAPSAGAQEEPAAGETVAKVISMPAMHVFRRHTVPEEEMFAFYGAVLGNEQLETYMVGNGGVDRFQIGASQLKMTGRTPGDRYVAGGVRDATGLRLLTFFFPDRKALERRFSDAGLPAPEFRALPGGRSSALVRDPDGQWVEMVVAPGEPESFYRQVEIGLTVSDMEASLGFYRDFVGLEPMEPVHDPVFDTRKYSFRNGNTIVSLRSFEEDLPADTGSGGIQYVVSDAEYVETLAKARGVTIDQPLEQIPGFTVALIWLKDPDGITNYFAGPVP